MQGIRGDLIALQEQVAQKKKEIQNLKDVLDNLSSNNSDLAELRSLQEEFVQKNAQLEKLLKELNGKVDAVDKNAQDNKNSILEQLKKTKEDLQGKYDNIKKELDDADKSRKALKEQLDSLKDNLTTTNTNIANLSKKLDTVKQDLQKAIDDKQDALVKKLEADKKALDEKLKLAKDERKDINDKIDALKTALATAATKAKTIQTKLEGKIKDELAKDTQPPIVIAVSTEDNDYNVDIEDTKSVVVKFSEKIKTKTLTKDNVQLMLDNQNILENPDEIKIQNNVITITPAKGLRTDKTYILKLSNKITDEAENALEEVSFTFHTKMTQIDDIAPKVSMTMPYPTTNVPVDSKIMLEFNEGMDKATIKKDNIKLVVKGTTDNLLAEDELFYNPGTNTLHITKKTPLATDTKYEFIVTTAVTDDAKTPNAIKETKFSFETEAAPTVSMTTPNPTTDVAKDSELVYDASTNTLTITKDGGLEYTTDYKVIVTDKVTDDSTNPKANAITETEFTFKTKADPNAGGCANADPNLELEGGTMLVDKTGNTNQTHTIHKYDLIKSPADLAQDPGFTNINPFKDIEIEILEVTPAPATPFGVGDLWVPDIEIDLKGVPKVNYKIKIRAKRRSNKKCSKNTMII